MEFCRYRDVQYYILLGLKELSKSLGDDELDGVKAENLLRILMKIMKKERKLNQLSDVS